MSERVEACVDGELEELPRDECFELLRSRPVGRLAVSLTGRAPLVVPVNFVVDGDDIVFQSYAGTKLTALRDQPVSFQVDEIDPWRRTGWSVLVEGAASEVPPADIDHLSVEPWAAGDDPQAVRIVPTLVSGRRIRPPDVPIDPRGYL